MSLFSDSPIPVVTLAELPSLVAALAARIRDQGFRPDLIVYIDRGARLPAWELCREFGVGAVPVRARRRGHRLKRLLAPLADVLPRSLLNTLRRAEERTGIHRGGSRRVKLLRECDLSHRSILLLDDAADTGATMAAVKNELLHRGADPARLRCAVLVATTPEGKAQVDFFVLSRNSVLPWSTDSDERLAAEALTRQRQPPAP